MSDKNKIRIFGLNSSLEFAQGIEQWFSSITDDAGFKLASYKESIHDDGEPYFRALDNVRGCDCYVIQSLYSDLRCENGKIIGESPNDKFMKMLLFADSLKDASADRITAVIPYLAYSRQDRKVKSREPIYTKYTAKYIEQANINRVLTMDVHNLSAFQNAFRIQTDNLEAKNLLVNWLVEHLPPDGQFCILSPDTGGMGRARRFRDAVSERLGKEIDTACIDKSRVGGVAEGERVIGDVKDKWVILLDDMISSGKTVLVSQKAVEKAGGRIWAACCTHGLFVGNANEYLAEIPHLVTTDTVLPFRLNDQILNRLHVISTAKLFAQAIRRTHVGDSISELLS